ncbi:MAG TPA: SusC/RagA family TonB-linked outer membrane protein, partial [Bacteroidales bacterium]|nr:SusC/RagA family TonB-linked outer membrane protein [Bacteroidales bacterium]
MKLMFVMILAITLQASALVRSQDVKLKLRLENASIQEVFDQIEKQSEFNIFYKTGEIDMTKPVSINASNISVTEALNLLTKESGINFLVVDKTIVATPKVFAGARQAIKVSGTVKDAVSLEPIPGVSIQVEGSNRGQITDLDGNFSIDIPSSDAVLIFSSIGYNSERVELGGRTSIEVSLVPDIKKLDEVVVVGYGTQRRSQVVGSVSSVKSEELTKQPLLTASQGLQGKTSGIQIVSSGTPGSQPQVRIRGTNTITADANPIYVVDGVIVSDITNINTNDIESMDVLKDAASQAIYGSRAANGVILITTKAGKSGKTRVAFDAYVGVRTITSKVKMADAKTYAEYTNEARAYDGQDPMFDLTQVKHNTDWFDAISRDGIVQNYNVAISGGTNSVTYYFSANQFNDQGILKGNDYSRTLIRNSNDYKFGKLFRFGHTLNVSYAKNNIKPNEFDDAYRIGPTAPVKDENGNYGYVNGLSVANPVAVLDYTNHYTKDVRLQGNAFAELTPLAGLTVRSSFNFNRPEKKETEYTPLYYVSSVQQTSKSKLAISNSDSMSYIIDNNVNYKKSFLDLHEVNLTLGYSAEKEKGQKYGGTRTDVPDQENLWYLDQGNVNSATNYHRCYIKQRA